MIPSSTVTSKGQTTIPIEIREMLGLKPNMRIYWISMKPGQVNIVVAPSDEEKKDWPDNIIGKYADDSFDGVESLLQYKKEDMELEERGYL